jgi:zinc protease
MTLASLRPGIIRASVLLALLLVAASLFDGDARAQPNFGAGVGPIVERHVSNGMALVVQEDHRVPLVSLSLRYEGGEVAAPPGFEAVAELTTSLMTYATKHVPKGDYDRLLATAGATGALTRAWTNGITLQVTLPSSRLALPLWLWSDEVAYFADALDDAAIVSKKAELREKQRLALEGSVLSALDELANQELYPEAHPYRRQIVTPASVDRVDRSAILGFHDKWITPAHATLTIVGDVTVEKATDLVERYFGSLPRGSSERVVPPGPIHLNGEVQVDVAANVPNAQVSIRWLVPRELSTEDGRLEVLSRCFLGDRTSLLYWNLIDEKKVARDVHARERPGAWASEFDVVVEGAPGRSAAELLAAYDAAMDAILAKGIDQSMIDGASYEATIGRVYAYEGSATRAADYGRFWTLAGNADYASRDFARFTGITPEIADKTLRRWLPRDRRVVLLVTPDPAAPAAGVKKGRRETPVREP